MQRYIPVQRMIRDFRSLRWSFQRISRFTDVSASNLIRAVNGESIPRESTEQKIRTAYETIFHEKRAHSSSNRGEES